MRDSGQRGPVCARPASWGAARRDEPRTGSWGGHPPEPPTFTSLLHEAEEVVQELLAFRVLVQFVELGQEREGSALLARAGQGDGRGQCRGWGPSWHQYLASPLSSPQLAPKGFPDTSLGSGLPWAPHLPCTLAASVPQFPCPGCTAARSPVAGQDAAAPCSSRGSPDSSTAPR